jgi:hypothetical protein
MKINNLSRISGIFRIPLLSCTLLFFVFFQIKAHTLPAVRLFATAIEGRWDITINEEGKEKPAWLDVRHSGLKTLVGYFVASFRRNGKWA